MTKQGPAAHVTRSSRRVDLNLFILLAVLAGLVLNCVLWIADRGSREQTTLRLEESVRSLAESVESEPFRIGRVTYTGFAPFDYGNKRGFFRERGLNVRFEQLDTPGRKNDALRSNKVEAVIETIDMMLWRGQEENVPPCKVVFALGESCGADAVKRVAG